MVIGSTLVNFARLETYLFVCMIKFCLDQLVLG